MISRCHLCPRHNQPVLPTGPTPARVLFIGEAPSYTEDEQGLPFVGRTGQELDHTYLPLANLPRSHVHICNARYCSSPGYENPTPEQAISCSSVHLGPLLAQVKPEIIVPMGAIACSMFHGVNLNKDHGLPRPGKWGGWEGIVFPMFHPSAGMHTTSYMIPLMDDFHRLGELIKQLDAGTFEYPTDLYPEPDYRVCRTVEDVAEYLGDPINHTFTRPLIGEDTESLPDGYPYCVTISHTPGTGRLIYVHDEEPMTFYRSWLDDGPELQLFHNYLHDVFQFEQLSLSIRNFRDTMVLAYELCMGGGGDDEGTESKAGRGSLSLKILAHRHLAIQMTSFQDTVYPHSKPYVIKYLQEAQSLLAPAPKIKRCTCGCPQSNHLPKGKTQRPTGACTSCGCQKCKLAKPSPMSPDDKSTSLLHRKIGTLLTALNLNPDANPWKRIKEWHDHDHEILSLVMGGPVPKPSIAHVPEKELLTYAVRDADATLRLYQFIQTYSPWLFY